MRCKCDRITRLRIVKLKLCSEDNASAAVKQKKIGVSSKFVS